MLEQRPLQLRCLCRQPDRMKWRTAPTTEVVAGDVLVPESLAAAMQGVHTAYYLVHSLGTQHDFEQEDRQAAANFGTAARQAGVRRIIYLGGLGNPEHPLSPHLRSRQETGQVLRSSGIQVIELRASISRPKPAVARTTASRGAFRVEAEEAAPLCGRRVQ